MRNPDLPQGHSAGHSDETNSSRSGFADRSRLEQVLTKGSLWKKQTLQNIESNNARENSDSDDRESKTAHMLRRLSLQLEERNEEILRLRQTVSILENEKSKLDRTHQREIQLQRAELESLQNAYDQFERESDSLLSELGEQNERLLNECRYQNGRSLLKS